MRAARRRAAPTATTVGAVTLSGSLTFNQDNLAQARHRTDVGAWPARTCRRSTSRWSSTSPRTTGTPGKVGFPRAARPSGIAVQQVHVLRAAERQADRADLRARDAALAGHHRLLDLRDRPDVREGHHRHRHEARASSCCRSTRRCPAPPRPACTSARRTTPPGYQAGTAMKQLLSGTGKVAILVGSLTAANATQRIAGFEQAHRRHQHHGRAEGQRQPVGRHRAVGRGDHPGEQPGRQRPVRRLLLRRPGARPGRAVGQQDRQRHASSATTRTRRPSPSSSPA